MKKICVIVIFFLSLPTLSFSGPYVRIGLFVGDNSGIHYDTPLRFAEKDARIMYRVMLELGKLSPKYSRLLIDCERNEMLATLEEMRKTVREVHHEGEKVIFILFYSGHADSYGLHINGGKLPFALLKKRIAELKSDIFFGIFDTCQSGAITAMKGGVKGKPFSIKLVEEPDIVGSVYLTSSLKEEISQESEAFSASLFTYYLVSALRGAADLNLDRHISLTEAYRYTYINTLKASSETTGMLQHPNFQYNLHGKGELILSYLPSASVHIIFPRGVRGNFFITSEDTEDLFVEVLAKPNQETKISLPRGSYIIKKKQHYNLLVTRANLRWGGNFIVEEDKMKSVPLKVARKKGISALMRHNNTFSLFSSFGGGMYEGMDFYQQVGFGSSFLLNKYELGFTFSYAQQDFSYKELYPTHFSSFHETLFLKRNFSFHPFNNYFIPFIGFSADAFQATFDSNDLMNESVAEADVYRSDGLHFDNQYVRGHGLSLLAGFSVPLPRETTVSITYEMQILWSDIYAEEKIEPDNVSTYKFSNKLIDEPINFGPIDIVNDEIRGVRNFARHQVMITFSYLF
ncbi:caspase domain-containing protein [candidate division CSSED10-310 bacterium]|uniref:Caspase domain-containing protein n=1 Tax=candidate division CSSED10-310 bacterium TaxID=2855610 RepID=A0ABV6Z162_UNCC1